MKSLRFFCVLLLWCLVVNTHVFAKSSVWKVSKDGNHLFLGGTFHLLTQSDYPLPNAFERAYTDSMIVVLETDIQKFGAPEFQQTILQHTTYPDDQNITQFLTPDTLHTLEIYLAERGIPMTSMAKFKPGMLSVILTMIELQNLGLSGAGVDESFSSRALNDSKEIKHLETVYEQLEFLSTMGVGNENEFIEHTLNDMKNLPSMMGAMKNAWRIGDIEQLQKIALDPLAERFPKLYNSLLVERNTNWVPQIEQMLKTKDVEFVLFGALHLAGKESILNQLQKRGCDIERL